MLQGTSRGTCDGFEIEISLESDAPAGEIATLFRLAHQMCFTEDAIGGRAKLEKRHLLNGQPFDVDG